MSSGGQSAFSPCSERNDGAVVTAGHNGMFILRLGSPVESESRTLPPIAKLACKLLILLACHPAIVCSHALAQHCSVWYFVVIFQQIG